METIQTDRRQRKDSLWRAGLMAAGIAAGVNVIFYFVALAGGYVPGPGARAELTMRVALGSVVVASIIAPLVGTLLYAAIRTVARHAMMVMALVGGAVLLIASFVPYALAPGGLAGISPADCGVVAILQLMHGFTAIVTLGVLYGWDRRHSQA